MPIITNIVNVSMCTGNFPSTLKNAIVTPILKKPSLDPNVLKNYRPISNIQFISKVIENIVATRYKDYLSSNKLSEPLQSAYRQGHSTETALLKVKNDFMHELDEGRVVLLVMLDLTAAFDTIDHATLIHRLRTMGVSGPPLDWFQSYMSNRHSRVNIDDTFSAAVSLDCGLAQGSVMGPLSFTIYTLPLGMIIRKHNLSYHIYADDTQLYTAFNPKHPQDQIDAINRLQNCILDIQRWMTHAKLKLNMEKTEFFVVGSPHNLKSISTLSLKVSTTTVKSINKVRNLGIIFDSTMSMSDHVNGLCRTLNYQLRNISRIRRYLSEENCHHVVRALVSSRLDYGNSLLAGITEAQLKKIQRIQNKAARLIFGISRRDHISPYITHLHWLPVKQRVNFKILVLIYQCINNSAPIYLSELISMYNTHSNKRNLRSSKDITKLIIPKTKRSAGDCGFSVYGPRLWNSLPTSIRLAPSLQIFKRHLKTHLFELL